MTKKQPDALRLAGLLELAPEDGVEPQTTEDAAAELRRQHTRIAELQARIKTMTEEHADELMVAHLDGRMRAEQAIPGVQWQCGPQANGFTAPQQEAQEPVAIIEHTLGGSIQYCPLGTAYKLPMGVQFNLYTELQPLPASQGDALAARAAQDGGDVAMTTTAAPARAADSVLEGAARLTYEQAHAIRQGHEISASDGYFEARPQIDSNDRRKVFQAGFERGWDAARKQGETNEH